MVDYSHIIRKEKTNQEKRIVDLIKRKREALNLTQEVLSMKINRSYNYVTLVEEGHRMYSSEDMRFLSSLFNCKPEDLMLD